MTSIFELQQVFKDPRSGLWDVITSYSTYETRAEAMKEARKMKGGWRIVETKVVAQAKIVGA